MSALYSAIESQRTLGGRSAEAEWPPALTLAAAAAVTSHMKLAAAVLLLPLYSPLKLAEDTAVLDCLSNGRLIVGVAPGYVAEEFTAFGIPRAERFGRMWEALDLMKLAWTKDRFSYAGKYYGVPEATVTPKPVQRPHPPIWFGVSGPKSLVRAARTGGPLVVSPRHGLGDIKEHVAIFRRAAREGGHSAN